MMLTTGQDIRVAFMNCWHRLSPRQQRLLPCAFARRRWRLLRSEASRRAVMLGERTADGFEDGVRLHMAHRDAKEAIGRARTDAEAATATVAALCAEGELNSRSLSLSAALYSMTQHYTGGIALNEALELLDDLLIPRGCPDFASWRTPDSLALAQRIYEARDFASLPVLGDALEDAGCDHLSVLAHCREAKVHARGCWVLEMLTQR